MRKVRVTLLAVTAAITIWVLFPILRRSQHPPLPACKFDTSIDKTVDCPKRCGPTYDGITETRTEKTGITYTTYYCCCPKGYKVGASGQTCYWYIGK